MSHFKVLFSDVVSVVNDCSYVFWQEFVFVLYLFAIYVRLSAVCIMLFIILIPWRAFAGSGVFVSTCYISFVISFPFAYL